MEEDRTKLTNSMPNTEPNKASKQYLKDKFGAALKCTKGTNTSLEVQNPCSYVQVLTLGTPLQSGNCFLWMDNKHQLEVTYVMLDRGGGRKRDRTLLFVDRKSVV